MKGLNVFLENYIEVLENIININNNNELKKHIAVALDFASRTKNNIKGLKLLIENFEDNEFIIVPTASIMRTVTSDALTLAYLTTFLTNNLNQDQKTFSNELNCIHLETLKVIEGLLSEKDYEDFKQSEENNYFFKINKLKNLRDLHESSDTDLIDESCLTRNLMLSEKRKYDRLKKMNIPFNNYVEMVYLSNKWFSQYYHYSLIAGKISRTKNHDMLKFDCDQIKNGIISSSLIVSTVLKKLEIMNESTFSNIFQIINDYKVKNEVF